MKTPAASVWLDAWERCMSAPPVRRPTLLLEAFHGEDADPGQWELGRREAALLRLRSALFGVSADSVVACPQCAKLSEFTVDTEWLLAGEPKDPPAPVKVNAAGARATFRLPTGNDLEAAAKVASSGRRQFLLAKCLAEGDAPSDGWTTEFYEAAAEKMSEADPLGNITFALQCAECAHHWQVPFDAGSFLWTELNAWAARMMSEIHLLAMTYGWTEAEIIALPPNRRRYYLDRLQQSS